jgi:uncharacterized protein
MIASTVRELIGTDWTDQHGTTKPLTVDDVIVVAPYNDQVARVREVLEADTLVRGVPVGTVDKFQGQEAAVVFFSMTSSSSEDMPRGPEFLFSRNRLNVAISRARAKAVIACSPGVFAVTPSDYAAFRGQQSLKRVLHRGRTGVPLA